MERNEIIDTLFEYHGEYPSHTGLGCYGLYYITADCGVLCSSCANENQELTQDPDDKQWYIVEYNTHWECYESSKLYCDNCYYEIEPEYGYLEE